MTTNDFIISDLPSEFTRQELLKEMIRLNYSLSKANQVIEHGLITGKLKRIGRGRYAQNES